MGFRSIRTKYVLLVVCCVVASALIIGGVCVHNSAARAARWATQNMNLTCETYKYKFDASLRDVQNAVEASAAYASDSIDSVERFSTDEAYRDAFAADLENILALETQNTAEVTSYYVRFSPDLLSFEKGFRYTRESPDQPFQRTEIVRIEDYQQGDEEHVGWYYAPIEQGSTTWLEPYYNYIFGRYMVSCVCPFYSDGELVGVIGMDIDFNTLVDDLEELRIFDDGYAFLCSAEGKIYYHPLYEAGTYIQQDVMGFDAQLENESSGDVLFSGISKGEDVDYAFRTLTNGMRLVLRAPVSEIYAEAMDMISTIVILVVVAVAVSIIVTILVSLRITKPLRELTSAAGKISRGDYDIKLQINSRDEVGTLARTLQMAATELWASAEYMRQLAYKDALTGVRNKTAYNLEIEVLESRIATGNAKFGIAVFDVNNLKLTNDTYGHEQGNKIIKTGCDRICQTFSRSPVFRIGGDEFVAVLQGEDLEHYEDRLREFDERAERESAAAEQPQDIVQVAVGVAFYDPKLDDDVQSVFDRADAAMYKKKREMKGEEA